MSKRFSDTEKWKDQFFQNMGGKLQLFFLYVLDNCDCAGVWKVNFRLFKYNTGFDVTRHEVETLMQGRIVFITDEIAFLPKFIKFQYGKTLHPGKSKIHLGVIKALEFSNIDINSLEGVSIDFEKGSERVSKGLANPTSVGVGVDSGVGVEEGVGVGQRGHHVKSNVVDPSSIIQLFNKQLAGIGKIKPCPDFFISPSALEDFKIMIGFPEFQKIEKWKDYFEVVASNNYLTSRGMATIPWLLKSENAFKVLSGQFQNHDKNEPDSDYLARMKELELKYDNEASA